MWGRVLAHWQARQCLLPARPVCRCWSFWTGPDCPHLRDNSLHLAHVLCRGPDHQIPLVWRHP